MNKLRKRLLFGALIIIFAMAIAILSTCLMDWIIARIGHAERIEMIFSIGGIILAFSSIIFSFIIWTNNMGDGFDK